MTRPRWVSRTVFLFAAIGSAVGLGNVWRFPYLAGKYGGGAFLVPYAIALAIIGFPLLMLELAIGQKMQQGVVGSFRKLHPQFGGLGIFTLMTTFIVVSYYAVVMGWSLLYFLGSFDVKWSGDAQGYFFDRVLQLSDGVNSLGGINWVVLASLIAIWLSIYFCIWQGIKSVEKVVLYTVPVPIILLAVLLLRAMTLPGFLQGWALYLTPVWASLLDPEVWTAACSQVLYTLSLSCGIMVAYASYRKTEEDIVRDSWITTLADSGICLFSGLVVFAVLGYMAGQTDTPLTELAASGPGLAFVVFPKALSLMPLPWLFGALFFLMLLSLGIDSAFSLVEAINVSILDEKEHWQVSRVALGVCFAAFIAGTIYTTRAGLYFLDIIDHFLTSYNLLLTGIFEAILAGWIYGAEKLRRYINAVSHRQIGKWWNVSLKFVVPIVLVALLATQLSTDLRTPYEGYPTWALGIGWAIAIIPLVVLILLVFRDRQFDRLEESEQN